MNLNELRDECHATPLAADLFELGPKLRARAGGGL